MYLRCYDPNNKSYRSYGGKKKHPTRICQEWLDNPSKFEKWAFKHGYADDLTIDRIDPSGDYCPENCRWITRELNSKFTSTSNIYEVDGEIETGRGWAKKLNLNKHRINKYAQKHGKDDTLAYIKDTKDGFIHLIHK